MICIIDCGTSWLRQIKKIVTDAGHPYRVIQLDDLKDADCWSCSGIIISGAPTLLTEIDTQQFVDRFAFIRELDVPVLGICLGHQVIGLLHGAQITRKQMVNKNECVHVVHDSPLFANIENNSLFQEEHSEFITLPDGFVLLAQSQSCGNEAMKHPDKPMYGVQFHPEVSGVPGVLLMINFLSLCGNET